MIFADAPAKINLSLHVTGKRADGYHTLSGLVMFADLADRLQVEASEALRLEVRGPFTRELAGGKAEDNLIIRAARAVARYGGLKGGVHFILDKVLPVGAGLGGGSADAAAAIKLLLMLWNVSLEKEVLQKLALELGADVPMCLASVPAMVGGIGDEVLPAAEICDCPAVLVRGRDGVSTVRVFSAYASGFSDLVKQPPSIATPEALVDYLRGSHNDLEQAAFSVIPEIVMVRHALAQSDGCLLARMSGSGSACFGLFENHEAAEHAAHHLQEIQPLWWVRAVTLHGTGKWRADGNTP